LFNFYGPLLIINGSIGNDRLNGGLGNDKLIGVAGADAFIFDSALKNNIDTITGFTPKNDQLQLDSHIFTKLAAGNLAADNFVIGIGVKAHDSDDYVLFNPKTGALYYDADGSGGGVAVKFAVLTGVSDLSATDFLIIGDSVLL
jgi:Ca2+-binding RTX toxin-like protein